MLVGNSGLRTCVWMREVREKKSWSSASENRVQILLLFAASRAFMQELT